MIWVVGIGEDGLDGLGKRARGCIEAAQVLVGGVRHHGLVPDFAGDRVDWSGGIDAGLDAIEAYHQRGQAIVVLASGDPLYFGVGNNVVQRFGADAVQILPAPGAVALACAAMGWSQPDVQVVTIHGRPLESLNRYLVAGERLVVLSRDGDSPAEVAQLLTRQGYGASRITVLAHLGGGDETRFEGLAHAWPTGPSADLHTLAIELVADATARPFSRQAGLPDDAFEHDGQLTKRAVRAVTLSSLAPLPGEMLWDLGAGAGSVAIEWMRSHERCQAVAVERDPARAQRIERNAAAMGVPRLAVRVGDSFEALDVLDGPPDAIFVGGGVSAPGLLAAAWRRLRPGGRLVANAVTPASATALEQFQQDYDGELIHLAVNIKQNKKSLFVNKAPITHYMGTKPAENNT